MKKTLISHLKSHKITYGILSILILGGIYVIGFNQTAEFGAWISELSGDITRIRPTMPTGSVQRIHPDAADIRNKIIPCAGSNSAGGDGSYSACVGNSITHTPSGIVLTPTAYNDLSCAVTVGYVPGGGISGNSAIVLKRGGTTYVGGTKGSEIGIRYDFFNVNGAYISIISKANRSFLTLINVHDSGPANYEDVGGWYGIVKKGVKNPYVHAFDVVIWHNYDNPSNPSKVSLYEFDSTFDPFKPEFYKYIPDAPGYSEGSHQDWVDYREGFNILNVDIPIPPSGSPTNVPSSKYYLDAFKMVAKTIVEKQPAEHFGVKYYGHGSGGGTVFSGFLNKTDSERFLAYMNSLIGKKLDFLDWSTNCEKGNYNVVEGEYRYADYILASDLERGVGIIPTGMVLGSVEDFLNLFERDASEPAKNITMFFSPEKSIRESLVDMLNEERLLWETATPKNNMIALKIKQSISIFETDKFENMNESVNLKYGAHDTDILDYIRKNHPLSEQQFYDFRFKTIDNKDFFKWDTDLNGLWKDGFIWEANCSLRWDPNTNKFVSTNYCEA